MDVFRLFDCTVPDDAMKATQRHGERDIESRGGKWDCGVQRAIMGKLQSFRRALS